MYKHERAAAGFTLIELMIGLAIAALLATLSLGSYDMYKRKVLRLEGADLVHAITVSQIQYRDRFNRYGDYSQLLSKFPNVSAENFSVVVTPVAGFQYQQYDAEIRLDPEFVTIEETCVRYTIGVRGGLTTVRTFNNGGTETTVTCIYR